MTITKPAVGSTGWDVQVDAVIDRVNALDLVDNVSAADLRDRSTHTGTQAESTVTNLVTDLAAKAPLASPTFTGTVTAPRVISPPVTLTDGATPALDASLGEYFRLTALGDRTIAVPANPTDGQAITIEHLASGAARTLALNTGTGGFLFGTTITALTQTVSGKRDFIRAIYNTALNKWLVVGYSKGF